MKEELEQKELLLQQQAADLHEARKKSQKNWKNPFCMN